MSSVYIMTFVIKYDERAKKEKITGADANFVDMRHLRLANFV